MTHRIVHIRREAPVKPAPGQPCNGCGICCLIEPCPLGQVLSLRRRGRCRLLRWDEVGRRYRCTALVDPVLALRRVLPRNWSGLIRALGPWLGRLAPRWIAAGRGCDCDVVVNPLPDPTKTDRQSGHD